MTKAEAEKLAIKLGLSTWDMGDDGFGGEDVPHKSAVDILMGYEPSAKPKDVQHISDPKINPIRPEAQKHLSDEGPLNLTFVKPQPAAQAGGPPINQRSKEETVWFVEHVINEKSEGWWTGTPKGQGGWITNFAWAAKRYSEAEAKAVAAALDYFPAPFRWSHWVATEHIFIGGTHSREVKPEIPAAKEPRTNPHLPGCPRFSGVGECDCDTNEHLRPEAPAQGAAPGARIQELLKEFIADFARLNEIPAKLANPKYNAYVEGADDFAEMLERRLATPEPSAEEQPYLCGICGQMSEPCIHFASIGQPAANINIGIIQGNLKPSGLSEGPEILGRMRDRAAYWMHPNSEAFAKFSADADELARYLTVTPKRLSGQEDSMEQTALNFLRAICNTQWPERAKIMLRAKVWLERPIGGVARMMPVEAQEILADPKATPEDLERAYAMEIQVPCDGNHKSEQEAQECRDRHNEAAMDEPEVSEGPRKGEALCSEPECGLPESDHGMGSLQPMKHAFRPEPVAPDATAERPQELFKREWSDDFSEDMWNGHQMCIFAQSYAAGLLNLVAELRAQKCGAIEGYEYWQAKAIRLEVEMAATNEQIRNWHESADSLGFTYAKGQWKNERAEKAEAELAELRREFQDKEQAFIEAMQKKMEKNA